MFRLLKLRPPHGWNAVFWELGIVTVGVLLALAAQQWVENRTIRGKVEASKTALRDELAEHYAYAVEFRTVYPCITAQLSRLRERVLSSGPLLEPAPVYAEPNFDVVLRIPSKVFPTAVWDGAISDGIVQRYEPAFRRLLAGYYESLEPIADASNANNEAEYGLASLTHRLPLDPAVRYSVIDRIEQLSGRLENLDVLHGQLIDYLQQLKMVPRADEALEVTQRYGTYKFCESQNLPMRSLKEAMQPVPN